MDPSINIMFAPSADNLSNLSNLPAEDEVPSMNMGVRVTLVMLYLTTDVLSLGGNFLVIVSLLYGTHMRNAIAPYLFNLAFADIAIAIFCIPFSFTQMMLEQWIFPSLLCPISFFAQVVAVTLSILTLVAISIDRYAIIKDPFESRFKNQTRKKITLIVIWLLSLLVGCVELVVAKERRLYGSDAVVCEEMWSSDSYRMTYTTGLFVITYLFPLVFLAIAYYKIGKILSQRLTAYEQSGFDINSSLLVDFNTLEENCHYSATYRHSLCCFLATA